MGLDFHYLLFTENWSVYIFIVLETCQVLCEEMETIKKKYK